MLTICPPIEQETEPWPSLGGQVVQWIEANLVHGPGDLRGMPVHLDDEKRYLLWRMYEVWPQGHAQAGRRRFHRAVLVMRKGVAKTELAAMITAAELAPDAPVRCVGWDANGNPIGGPVTDPYIPMIAYTEEQTEELAYGALKAILEESRIADQFDIGLERVMRRGGDGKATALASSPNALEGARTSFQHFDETHRFTSARLRAAHRTMQANLAKRRAADPWELETTTAWVPGQQSVAEDASEYARAVLEGQRADSRLFYYHRFAGPSHDLTRPEGIREAVVEASGPAAEWSNLDAIVAQWEDPNADQSYLERVYLDRPVQAASQVFDVARWDELAAPRVVPAGELITLGFDGSRYYDATGIIATHVKTGYQWVVGLWERPAGVSDWEVPRDQVDNVMSATFERWNVWRLNADVAKWEETVARWAGRWEKRVVMWPTSRLPYVAAAVRAYLSAIRAGELSHDGDPRFRAHIGSSCRQELTLHDEEGEHLFLLAKETKDSPKKIDLAYAGLESWKGRMDALAEGADLVVPARSVYEDRGLLVIG